MEALRYIPSVLTILWESGRWSVGSNIVIRALTAFAALGIINLARWIVDAVAATSHGQALPPHFWYWVGGEFFLAALSAVAGRIVWFLDGVIADQFSRHLSVKVMAHAARLDLMSYEDPEFYDQLERARAQTTDQVGMVQAAGSLLQQTMLAIGFCGTLLWFSPWLLITLIICILPAFIGESHFAFVGYRLNFQQTGMRREVEYLRELGASKTSAKEMRLFGLSDHFTDRFRHLSDVLFGENLSLAKRRLTMGVPLSLLTSAGYYGAYVWVVWWAVNGKISVGTMTFLAAAIAGASGSIQTIFTTFSRVADQALFVKDLAAFFDVVPKIQSKPGARQAPQPIQEGFRLENVSFRYPGQDRNVLSKLNLEIRPGQRLALVGENGEGKTTLVKLLTRLYDPTEGRVLLDGIDLREYDTAGLAREVGVIFQDFMRYDMTAIDNIAVGRIEYVGKPEFRSEIEESARKSLADGVVGHLPHGLDQMLGRRFEEGVDLSGGEWQKIALARAYLRNAQMLVLDEPTAALDARSEMEVFERFADLTKGKMALVISHRFSTVRMTDRILVLAEGKIAEEGSHDELMALKGRYASMFEMQAASYR